MGSLEEPAAAQRPDRRRNRGAPETHANLNPPRQSLHLSKRLPGQSLCPADGVTMNTTPATASISVPASAPARAARPRAAILLQYLFVTYLFALINGAPYVREANPTGGL